MCHGTRCTSWISLHSIGIQAEGCLRDASWIRRITFQSTQLGYVYINLPFKRLLCIDSVAQGQFGYIDLAIYETPTEKKEVYVKRPILTETLLMEACIQKLVHESLASIGFPLGSPPVVCIFALDNGSVCFAMEPIPHTKTLDRFLNQVQGPIDTIIVDCLLQLCCMLSHLHNVLGINHRDVKPSNFLIQEHDAVKKKLTVGHEHMTILSRYDLCMIDFGFACLGSYTDGTYTTEVSLSTVYPPTDICLKSGRDMFLFLGLLYLEYHNRLSSTLSTLFESWIDVNLCAFMRKNREYSMQWLYFMAGNEGITKFTSEPVRVFRDLQKL
jgi:serine/threonine protein kinase